MLARNKQEEEGGRESEDYILSFDNVACGEWFLKILERAPVDKHAMI